MFRIFGFECQDPLNGIGKSRFKFVPLEGKSRKLGLV